MRIDEYDNATILEVKADKQPIGKFEMAKPFTAHTIRMLEGDTIYVFTDGYQDQFGGPRGKKFKTKQLKQLLTRIIHQAPIPKPTYLQSLEMLKIFMPQNWADN